MKTCVLRDAPSGRPQDEDHGCSGNSNFHRHIVPHPEGLRSNRLEGRSEVPDHAKAPGQQWPKRADGAQRPRCYKCIHWRSNMPLTGRCAERVRSGLWTSHDTMPGDACAKFEIKDFNHHVITPLVGVTQPCADTFTGVRRKTSELGCRDKPGNDEKGKTHA